MPFTNDKRNTMEQEWGRMCLIFFTAAVMTPSAGVAFSNAGLRFNISSKFRRDLGQGTFQGLPSLLPLSPGASAAPLPHKCYPLLLAGQRANEQAVSQAANP